jgi:hypothetical protein
VSDQVIDNTAVDAAESQQPLPPSPLDKPTPSPADLPRHTPPASPEPVSDSDGDGDKQDKGPRTPEQYEAAMAKLRKENASWRTKYREAEPIVNEHKERIEAEKTETQKAIERAEAAEKRDREREESFTRLDLAVTHGIEADNIDLIGSGSREEMETRALRVKAMQQAQGNTAPPSDRPVEGLRPGASPEPPAAADDSYPESWKPSHVRDRERTQHGQ